VGLGRLAENSMVRFVVQTFNRTKDVAAEFVRNALERLLESLERPLADICGGVIDDVLNAPNLPSSVRRVLLATRNPEHPVAIVGLLAAVVAVLTMLVPAGLAGVTAKVRQISFFVTRPFLLDFSTWHVAMLRDNGLRSRMDNDLRGQGWRDEQITAARLASEARLGVGEIVMAMHRDEITQAQAYQRLRDLGIPGDDTNIWLRLANQIPNAQDLVRFALREVWDDGVAQRYGYDQGMAGDFVSWMGKIGFEPEWTRAFWRAHWNVPSGGQGVEMMHRGIISESELVELLKVNDIAPGWIPRLMQMARPVPGRIDRRWAFEEGEISEDQLFDLYKKDGYDDFWAGVLSNTVVKRSVSEAKGLTRAAIVAAYAKRRLSSSEAVELLSDIGIPQGVASFYLGQADSDRSDDLLDRRIKVVGRQYTLGDSSASDASEELRSYGVGSAEIVVLLEEWAIALGTKVKRPSRANLDNFFKDGVIAVAEYRDQMDRLGYSGQYVDWYLAALAIDRQELAEKAERQARVENERVQKDRKRTDYQQAKSRLDVNIAELNAAIAADQVALVTAQNERDSRLDGALPVREIAELERLYKPLLFDTDAAISEARLQITRVQTNIKLARANIATIDQSLVNNVDMTIFAELKAERLNLQTASARLAERIAANQVLIAMDKESLLQLVDDDAILNVKAHILALQTENAQFQEQRANALVQIEEIDESLSATLSIVRKADLQSEKAGFRVNVADYETEIAEIRSTIRVVQGDKERLEQELDAKITALPGADEQVEIHRVYLTRINEIESGIKVYKENIAQLRLEKSRLVVEWRN